MRTIIAAVIAAALITTGALAADGRSTGRQANRMHYVREESVGLDSNVSSIDLTSSDTWNTTDGGTSVGEGGGYTVCVTNEDSSNDLLVQFLPVGATISSGPSTLTTPPNATLTEVTRIEERETVCADILVDGWYWQSETAAVAAHALVSN